MVEKFSVGDKVIVTNFFGKTLLQSEVIEITDAGNVMVRGWNGLFRDNGTERRKVMFWTDMISLVKV